MYYQKKPRSTILKRRDLPSGEVEKLARDRNLCKNRKVAVALAQHPHLPRRLATALLRELYTFDLMKVAVGPASLPPEIKVIAERLLISRLETMPLGEVKTLARRASGGILDEMTRHPDAGVVRALLNNPRLTEATIVKALRREKVSGELMLAVRRHAKWSLRQEIRDAVLTASDRAEKNSAQEEELSEP
jgi:hypothetical protein